jgi:hypothetical protein
MRERTRHTATVTPLRDLTVVPEAPFEQTEHGLIPGPRGRFLSSGWA